MSNRVIEGCKPTTKRSEIKNLGLDNSKVGIAIRYIFSRRNNFLFDIKEKAAAFE